MRFLNFDSSRLGAGYGSDFTIVLPQPLVLEGPQQIGLFKASIWYSWTNINTPNGNKTFRYYNGTAYRTVTLDDGNYGVDDINSFLQKAQDDNGDSYTDAGGQTHYGVQFIGIQATGKCRILITSIAAHLTGYKLDLGTGNLYKMLGFNQTEYSVTTDSPNTVDITLGVNRIFIHCSVVDSCIVNSNASSDVIYAFEPDSPPNSLLNIQPNQVVYTPLTRTIERVRWYLTDQLGRPIDVGVEPSSFSIIIQPDMASLMLENNKLLSELVKFRKS